MAYSIPLDPTLLVSGFGDPLTAELTPRVQIDAVYGIVSTDVQTIVSGAGACTEVDATFVVASGAGAGDYGDLRSRRVARYRPGQAGRFRFTAAFSPTSDPAALQGAGAFSSTDGLLVLQLGGQIGICRRIPGTLAIWRLTLSVGSGGAENITVRLDGVDFVVASGGVLSTSALAARLAAQTSYTGWVSSVSPTSNGATVTFLQSLPGPTGTDFALSSTGTAAGTFTQIRAGAANSYADFRPQSAWNLDRLDGSEGVHNQSHFALRPEGLNVYQIDHTHLGTGPILWSVLGSDGRWIPFHRESFEGSRLTATQKNPTYRLGWFAARGSQAASVEVRGASAAGLLCGSPTIPLRNPFAAQVTNFTASTTSHIALAIRGRGEFAGRANQREIFMEFASVATETTNRTIRLAVWVNPIPASALTWSYVDQATSCVEIATPGSGSPVTFTGGRLLTALVISTGSGGQIDLEDLDIRLDAGDTIVFALATATSTGAASLSVTWRED